MKEDKEESTREHAGDEIDDAFSCSKQEASVDVFTR